MTAVALSERSGPTLARTAAVAARAAAMSAEITAYGQSPELAKARQIVAELRAFAMEVAQLEGEIADFATRFPHPPGFILPSYYRVVTRVARTFDVMFKVLDPFLTTYKALVEPELPEILKRGATCVHEEADRVAKEYQAFVQAYQASLRDNADELSMLAADWSDTEADGTIV